MKIDKLEIAKNSKYIGTVSIGEVFGYWKVIDNTIYVTQDKRLGAIYILCKCEICNNFQKFVNIHQLKKHRERNSGGCLSCSRKKCTPKGNQSSIWRGHGEIPMSYIHNIKGAAFRRNIPFDVTLEYLWQLFLTQNRTCKISGVPINFGTKPRGTASLDRIDRSKPYERGNVQWVHKDVNEMKWDKTDEELIHWCKIIVEHNK